VNVKAAVKANVKANQGSSPMPSGALCVLNAIAIAKCNQILFE